MDIIFWGATAQAKVLHEFIERVGFRLIALFDDNPSLQSPFSDVALYHGFDAFLKWKSQHGRTGIASLAAIGGARGKARCAIQEVMEQHSFFAATLIHPSAVIAHNTSIARGSQILAHAHIGTQSRLGLACIVNTSAVVEHECILGDGVHVAPGAVLTGTVTVGEYSLIGARAVILPGLTIGKHVTIGAGAVVTHDIPDAAVAYGNPARVHRTTVLT